MAAGKKETFRSFALINSLGGIALAVLTLSELLIVDMLKWKVLLRQKHRRLPDPTLIMKIFTSENGDFLFQTTLITVINILIYSSLNPIITVHQVSEDFPLSWLDTPFELPLARSNPAGSRMAGNLGLAIIPHNIIANSRYTPQREDTSFTTYRLQTDLSIIGDLYGPDKQEISRLRGRTFGIGSESYSSHLTTTDTESESDDEGWSPYENTRVLDFSAIADELLVSEPMPVPLETRRTRSKLRHRVVDQIITSDITSGTLYMFLRFS